MNNERKQGAEQSEEFKRFYELAKRIVAVPKSEVDKLERKKPSKEPSQRKKKS